MQLIMGPNGKMIPVQKVTMVYGMGPNGELRRAHVRDSLEDLLQYNEFYVSHFQTCSDPARFSRGGRGS
jgi:hypothetical protein